MFAKIYRQLRVVLYQHIGLLLIVTVVLITACQSSVPNSRNLENGQLPSTDCRVVKHAGGETTICGKPQKVVALEPKTLGMMLALDVQPSAYAEAYLLRSQQFDNPSKQIPYLGKFVTTQPINLGDRNNPSLESLTLLKPDLILGMKWQDNQLLSAIAPTVLIDDIENWEDHIQIVAQALHREENAQQVIGSHKQQLAEVRNKLTPLIKTHPRVLNLVCSQSMDYMELRYHGDVIRLLEEIGFQTVLLKNIERKPKVSPRINLEILAQLDADIIFVNTWLEHWNGKSTYKVPSTELQQKWAKNPLLHNSRAWKEGRVYFVDYTLWSGVISGPMADFLMLEKLPKLLLSSSHG